MGPKNRTSKKSEKQIKQEILEDWANVRQWIDELQHEWTERNKTTKAEDTKRQTSSEK
jgi:hypothetical protein